MARSLDTLPFDVFYQIATSLDDRDLIHLSRANHALRTLTNSDLIARKTVERVLRYSEEGHAALRAQAGYRKAVGHRFDINEAIATADPYSVCVLAFGADFLYEQGFLCYRVGHEIRLLNVHGVDEYERVLNLYDVLPHLEGSSHLDAAERVTLVHYHDGVLVLRVASSHDGFTDTLLVLDMQPHPRPTTGRRGRLLLQAAVPATVPIFVRNNRSYIWYGTFTALDDSNGVWAVSGVDLLTLQTINFSLDGVVEGDVGQTVAFEMYEACLYVVSTQATSGDDERYSSFYHCACYAPRNKGQKWNGRLWRREHREGPINEMWTDLSIRMDETTGRPVILECRREWRQGKSENHRTNYIEPLPTPEEAFGERNGETPPRWVNEVKDLNPGDNRQTYNERPEKRLRRYYHPEYEDTHDQNTRQEFIAVRTKHRSYHLSAATFVDLVNDPQADGLRSRDRLRLRTVSRKRKCPLDEEGMLLKPTQADADGRPVEGSEEQFVSRGVRLWPPKDSPSELTQLLCPDTRLGAIRAVSDERSLIYSVSSPGLSHNDRALILISFDPKIRFPDFPSLRTMKAATTGQMFPVEVPRPESSNFLIRKSEPLYKAIRRGYWVR
ncbi:hypothetical protein N7532_002106 [Penicillium argentinense]|uniref:F-box domain-containing protein n=1 Tax=Penicillium argentinense TaxID=1131581 RepID=A0A9W9KN22_9EURO|nr:uncharacterized protein N7532_002106 [Penicillium argentinense]KAJ5111571.1 hypothetical protein N7532_002106 [Penicillium argentinense]